jgi:hypothetical protein
MRPMRIVLLLVGCCCLIGARASERSICHGDWIDLNKNGRKDVYEDSAQPVARRVNDLLGGMSPEEKIGQLVQAHSEDNALAQFGGLLREGRISSFLDGSELIETPMQRNQLQKIAVEQSRGRRGRVDGDERLQLSPQVRSLALIGPFAEATDDLSGCWAGRGHPEEVVSLASGLRAKLSPDAKLVIVRGCEANASRSSLDLPGRQMVWIARDSASGEPAEFQLGDAK